MAKYNIREMWGKQQQGHSRDKRGHDAEPPRGTDTSDLTKMKRTNNNSYLEHFMTEHL